VDAIIDECETYDECKSEGKGCTEPTEEHLWGDLVILAAAYVAVEAVFAAATYATAGEALEDAAAEGAGESVPDVTLPEGTGEPAPDMSLPEGAGEPAPDMSLPPEVDPTTIPDEFFPQEPPQGEPIPETLPKPYEY
jgi:hypothetical protein